MAQGRNWEALSATYRGRLERGGVTRSAYESGVSLSGARGHAATPERPSRAVKHPAKYQAYTRKVESRKSADKLRRDVKRLGKRYDIPDILTYIRPEDRASYVASWKIANDEWQGSTKDSPPNFARARLDLLEQGNPDAPKDIGYYH